jgi:urease accessory protein
MKEGMMTKQHFLSRQNLFNHQHLFSRFVQKPMKSQRVPITAALAALLTMNWVMTATPALAHHPFGGMAPKTIVQGFLSGLGHPVIGLDHVAFVIAVGLLAATLRRGFTAPLAFLLAMATGTGLRLSAVTLPNAELLVAGSVVLFGLLLATGKSLNTRAVVLLTALMGLFHGYAYGEAVLGAEPTPIVAYLVGLTLVQGAIAFAIYSLSHRLLQGSSAAFQQRHIADRLDKSAFGLKLIRQAGFVLCGTGLFLCGALLT